MFRFKNLNMFDVIVLFEMYNFAQIFGDVKKKRSLSESG